MARDDYSRQQELQVRFTSDRTVNTNNVGRGPQDRTAYPELVHYRVKHIYPYTGSTVY